MFKFKRATANGVSLIFTFLVSSTEGELVDEIDGCSSLSIDHKFILKALFIILANSINVFL